MYRIEKNISVWIFFKFNNYFFSTGTPTTNKLNDGMLLNKFGDSISVTQQNSNGF